MSGLNLILWLLSTLTLKVLIMIETNHSFLVLNAGSSSLKFCLLSLPDETEQLKGLAERLGEAESCLKLTLPEPCELPLPAHAGHAEALQALQAYLEHTSLSQDLSAIAHRVVHGGEDFKQTTRLTPELQVRIRDLIPLAPLHNPANLAGVEAAIQAWPDLPQYAVFDTAFHQSMPQHAYLYALPQDLYREQGIRRYGFHGTSHAYISSRLRALQPDKSRRILSAHLGNGCSMAAILDGQSVDTSMGMTPLEGLVMGTRSGDLDPGVLLFLLEQLKYSAADLNRLLNKQSGLLGLSGFSNDVRSLDLARQQGNEQAQLALEIFAYRAAKAAAALMVALGGLDILAFTGGIGENAAWLRQRIVAHLNYLGLQIDPDLNAACRSQELCLSPACEPAVWVIPTQEERMIAREAYAQMKVERL